MKPPLACVGGQLNHGIGASCEHGSIQRECQKHDLQLLEGVRSRRDNEFRRVDFLDVRAVGQYVETRRDRGRMCCAGGDKAIGGVIRDWPGESAGHAGSPRGFHGVDDFVDMSAELRRADTEYAPGHLGATGVSGESVPIVCVWNHSEAIPLLERRRRIETDEHRRRSVKKRAEDAYQPGLPLVCRRWIDAPNECYPPESQQQHHQGRRQRPAKRAVARCADEGVQVFVRYVDDIYVEMTQPSGRVTHLQRRVGARNDLIDVAEIRRRRARRYLDGHVGRILRAAEAEAHTPNTRIQVWGATMTDVFLTLSGQDDNLGDSALRAGLLREVRFPGATIHVWLDNQTSDYVAGLALRTTDHVYRDRRTWFDTAVRSPRPVYVLNAGEINPQPRRRFPRPEYLAEMRELLRRGGVVVAAGIGLRDPEVSRHAVFDSVLRQARVLGWRDYGSRDGVGIGEVAPDWAYALGSATSDWPDESSRPWLAVTLRFDRPWPDDNWLRAVRGFAQRSGRSIVTVAQVSRDAPRAVALADALGGDYLVAPSASHDVLNRHVRSVFARSFAVISDRAHALIIGATEGAWPMGSAAQPQKITRILEVAQLGCLAGDHDGLASRLASFEESNVDLPVAIDSARSSLARLGSRMRQAMGA